MHAGGIYPGSELRFTHWGCGCESACQDGRTLSAEVRQDWQMGRIENRGTGQISADAALKPLLDPTMERVEEGKTSLTVPQFGGQKNMHECKTYPRAEKGAP